MKDPTVRLYLRVRLPDGRTQYLKPVWNRNHTLKANYAIRTGQAAHYPQSRYYLRFRQGRKTVWESVGAADVAVVALRNKEFALRHLAFGKFRIAILKCEEKFYRTLPSVSIGLQPPLRLRLLICDPCGGFQEVT